MKLEEAIGANLARLREESGLSQAQLGNALGAYLDKPWSRQAVSGAEKGRRAFTAAELVSLALSLGVSIDFLLLPVAPGLADLLPGEAELSEQAYEQAVVGTAPEGGPSAQALARAQGVLVAAARESLDAQRHASESLARQAVLIDHAALALGLTDKLYGPEVFGEAYKHGAVPTEDGTEKEAGA